MNTRRNVLKAVAASIAVPTLMLLPVHRASASARPDSSMPHLWNEPRWVRIHNPHIGMGGEFCYWRDGNWVMDQYVSLSALLLDHRERLAVQLQPALFDLIYITQRWYEMVERRAVTTDITSAFRTVRTNAIVGGARGGLHPQAAALDGSMRGVPMQTYASMLQAFRAGGVGLYSGHVHWDVGRAPVFWRGSGRES